jgi:hypothetical protein
LPDPATSCHLIGRRTRLVCPASDPLMTKPRKSSKPSALRMLWLNVRIYCVMLCALGLFVCALGSHRFSDRGLMHGVGVTVFGVALVILARTW